MDTNEMLVLVECDSWCGLYLKDELIFEGHSITVSDVVEIENEFDINFKNLKTTEFLIGENIEDFGCGFPLHYEKLNGYLYELE